MNEREGTAREEAAPVRACGVEIRGCRPSDRAGLLALGHPPALAGMFCPTPPRRLWWHLAGTHAVPVVAARSGTVAGSVQFLRSRRCPETWMFGHWRVAPQSRRHGLGRLLLREGLRALPRARRLYSYVSADNATSIAAHARLGFEAGRTLRGSAPLGALSTVGAPTPALELDEVGSRDRDALFGIYARAMGALWLRLFPRTGPDDFLGGALSGMRALAVAAVRGRPWRGRDIHGVHAAEQDAPALAGFVVWDGGGPTFFADPATCDWGLLARLASRLLSRGVPRDVTIELRGLPRAIDARPGPILLEILMGMPDIASQWRD